MHKHIKRLAHKKPIYNRFFMSTHRALLSYLTALCLCMTALAGEGKPEPKAIDLRTAISKSLQHNPELASFSFRLRSADSYVQQAAVGEKPELNLSVEDAFGSGDFSGFDSTQSTLSISWILERSLLERRIDTRQSEKNVVQIEEAIKQYDVSAATAHLFLTALALEEKLDIASQAKQSAMQALVDVRKRTNSGKAPIADLLRAEVELERRALEIDDITHELEVAKRRLAAQWGATLVDFSTLLGSLQLNDTVVDFPALEQRVVTSPRVRFFLNKERVKQSEVALAREEAKNRLRFNTGVRRFDRTDDYAVVFGVSVPFGRAKRNQAQIAALSEQQAGYHADARAEQINLSARLYGLYEGFKHNAHLSEALEKEIIPRLEKALVETRKAYEIGRYSYREWSSVQQEVLAARLELVATRLAAQSDRVELERLTGLSISTNPLTQSVQP